MMDRHHLKALEGDAVVTHQDVTYTLSLIVPCDIYMYGEPVFTGVSYL